MTQTSLVSVILPCFNGEHVIAEALGSILAQTYENLEVLVLDDGSTDATPKLIETLQHQDRRIHLSRSSTNVGLIATLNRGIGEAKGDFIARMDDDDISDPTRIERTMKLFAERPELSAAGTDTRYVSALTGRRLPPRPARCFEPAGARFMTLFAPPIVHPTLMARAEVLRDLRYDTGSSSLHTEDYQLFARMAEAGHALMNLREPLVTVRVRPSGVSRSNEATQIANFAHCSYQHLSRTTGMTPSRGTHRVLINRMTDETGARDFAAGLELLHHLESTALAGAPDEPTKADIRRVADMQRVDILSQAVLRGNRAVRTRAVAQVGRDFRRLLSGDVRKYTAAKLGTVIRHVR